MKPTRIARLRRVLSVAAVVGATVTVLAVAGGVNIAGAVAGLAQYGYGKHKVYLCHKGKHSIRVGKPGLAAHLRHGDRVTRRCTRADRRAWKIAKLKAKRAWLHDKAAARAAKSKARGHHGHRHGKRQAKHQPGFDAEAAGKGFGSGKGFGFGKDDRDRGRGGDRGKHESKR